ncbi:MAG: adenylyltransferase/cytidyltransferase family protein [Lentisphaerae bacterium]|nr:adenylyltransferase/cytidyltransferase family protein [Lentisphaerota bacterium]
MSKPKTDTRAGTSGKIVPFERAGDLFAELRGKGVRIVHCHGTFDLIHPGHIVHLEEAKALGDILVVTVTDARHVNKGPGRPCFNDELRSRTLAALACVDYVVLIPHAAAVEAIRLVQPSIYCKGTEYEDAANDVTGNIHDDVAEVQAHGGEIRYIGSVVFSSTAILNRHFDHIPDTVKSFCRDLASRVDIREFRRMVDSLQDLRVLVLGDTIIDQYAYLQVQGLTSKNRMISGRYLHQDTHLGGALAVVRHVKEFCPNVRFVSLLGTEPWVEELMGGAIAPAEDATIRDPKFTTVVKKRYVEPVQQGHEISKLFSINYIDNAPPSRETRRRLLDSIRAELKACDLVLLADFGHGLMQEEIRDLVQNEAPFLMLNCQTNSNNHGFNIITRQYRRADAFSLDLQEIMLSCGRRQLDGEKELAAIAEHFGSKYAWLTRGNVMTIGHSPGTPPVYIPPLVNDVTDTVGAGDAFFSLAGLAAVRGLPLDVATFLGQLAGAQAVYIVGNERPISRGVLLKTAMSLLNF